MNNILNITEKPEIDESISEYEFHSYEPITGTDLNRPVEIRFIETQDLFTNHMPLIWTVINSRNVRCEKICCK